MNKFRREQIIEPEPLAADPFTQILLILGLLTIILIPIVRFYGKIYRERKFDMIAERGTTRSRNSLG
jgi:hypothetical protein